MRSFYYHGTLKESLAMMADVLSLGLGLKILHNPRIFATKEPRWFHAVDDELARLFDADQYFVIGGPFTHHPLGFEPRPLDRPGYNLRVAEGGPVLHGCLPRVVALDGVPTLTLGKLVYQPSYYNPIAQVWDPPSEDLKDAYHAIVRCMKRHLIHRTLNRKFWITRDAWRLWREGRVRFIPWFAVQDGRRDLPFPFPPSDEE